MHHFKLLNQVNSTENEEVRFIKGNELKFTRVELFSFFFKGMETLQNYENKYNLCMNLL